MAFVSLGLSSSDRARGICRGPEVSLRWPPGRASPMSTSLSSLRAPPLSCPKMTQEDGAGDVAVLSLAVEEAIEQLRACMPVAYDPDAPWAALPGARFDPLPAISDALIDAILRGKTPDQTVNDVMWLCLGYVRDGDAWSTAAVPPLWRDEYPDQPPDIIGVHGSYGAEFDRPVKKAVQRLTRSIPKEKKQLLKTDFGFEGFEVKDLTPNRTRRATVANWLLYYRLSHA